MQFTVDARLLNRELAREMKERKIVSPPSWTPFVKTGMHKQRVPAARDWWFHRAAAVLRAVAVKGPIGTSKLAVKFGGRMNRGVKPDIFQPAGTNVLRKCLQQLEKAKLVKQAVHAGHKGRVLTKEGTSFLKDAMGRVEKMAPKVEKKAPAPKAPAKAPETPKEAPPKQKEEKPAEKPAPKETAKKEETPTKKEAPKEDAK
ncbi:MAG: 40S ribosomal protein S19 [Candidatus Woesearchaeota archaeon]|nr:40S ribosomal protein S19 [Candidatus Woesearchaeota archaeon]